MKVIAGVAVGKGSKVTLSNVVGTGVSEFHGGYTRDGGEVLVDRAEFVSLHASQVTTIKPSERVVLLNETLGRGSFGLVTRALLDGNEVAAKRSFDKWSNEFLLELEKLKAADSPRVVRFFGIAVVDRVEWAIMELCGMSLKSVLLNLMETEDRWLGKIDLAEASLGWIHQVAQGAKCLHDLDIIHGDLATRNVLVGPKCAAAVAAFVADSLSNLPPVELDLKISDFGLSSRSSSSKKTLVGDFRISPPLSDDTVSKKHDVWSFGVLCWEVLTLGAAPFAFYENAQELQTALLGGERLSLDLEPDGPVKLIVPDYVTEVIKVCWALDHKERPDFATLVQVFDRKK